MARIGRVFLTVECSLELTIHHWSENQLLFGEVAWVDGIDIVLSFMEMWLVNIRSDQRHVYVYMKTWSTGIFFVLKVSLNITLKQLIVFLAVPRQLNRWPCHWLPTYLLTIVEKHYHRALCETCDPWDMLSEWRGDMTWPETWHLRHWLHFWQLRTTILTFTLCPWIKSDGDSIRNSCYVSSLCLFLWFIPESRWL